MRQALPPALALVCVPVAALVAHLLDRSAWLAALGAALVLVHWALDVASAKLGMRGSFNQAIGVGVSGMVLRLLVVLGALALVGALTSKSQTLTCIMAFIGTFTVYFLVRLAVMPFQLTTGGGATSGGPPARGRDSDEKESDEQTRRATVVGPVQPTVRT